MAGRLLALLVACAPLVAACTTAPPVDAATLLAQAADRTASATSLRFALLREGEPAVLDLALSATFSEAVGEYRAPDRVHAKVKVLIRNAILQLDVLWLPEGFYATDPFTGKYAKLGSPAFDAAGLFRADGLAGILTSLREPSFVGKEKLEDGDTYHVRATADGARLKALTGGALVAGAHRVDVWIDVATLRVVRVHDTEPGGAGWRLDLSGYDEPVQITAP